jgi:hypothetical protein
MKVFGAGLLVVVLLIFSGVFWPSPNGPDSLKIENDAKKYGLEFRGNWTETEKINVTSAAKRVGVAMARAQGVNISSSEMFKCFFNTGINKPMIIEKFPDDPRTLGAEVFSTRYMRVYGTYRNVKDADRKTERLMVHELGHMFENRIYEIVNIKVPRKVLHWTQINDYHFPMRGRGDSVLNGFAGGMDIWQFDMLCDPAEEFADMFVGWTYSMWEDSPEGRSRDSFMGVHMKSWISIGCPKNVR